MLPLTALHKVKSKPGNTCTSTNYVTLRDMLKNATQKGQTERLTFDSSSNKTLTFLSSPLGYYPGLAEYPVLPVDSMSEDIGNKGLLINYVIFSCQ